MVNIKNRKKYLLFISICLIILLLLYFGIKKEGFNIDEIYSYGLSNSHYTPFPHQHGQWLKSDYYNSYLMTTPETNFEYGSVVFNQSRDVHPPLYYMLLHTVSSVFPYTFTKWFGLAINMFLFILTVYFVIKIINYFTKNNYIGIIGMVSYSVSIGAISNFLFLRMYSLLAFLQVLLIYLTINFIKTKSIKKLNILWLIITIILGGLTHYYFYIFAFLTTLFTLLVLLFNKEYKKIFIYALQSLVSVITAFLIFPSAITHVTSSYRGTEAIENAGSEFSLDKLSEFINIISNQLFSGRLYSIIGISLFILALLIILRIARKDRTNYLDKIRYFNKETMNFSFILLTLTVYIILISQISPYQNSRYVYSIYPFVSILFIVLLYKLFYAITRKRIISTGIIGLMVVILSVNGLVNLEPDHMYKGMKSNHDRIERLDVNTAIVLSKSPFRISSSINELRLFENIYPFVPEEDRLSIPNDELLYERDSLVVFVDQGLEEDPLLRKINENYNFNQKEFLYSYYYDVYLFTR